MYLINMQYLIFVTRMKTTVSSYMIINWILSVHHFLIVNIYITKTLILTLVLSFIIIKYNFKKKVLVDTQSY